MAPNRRVQYLSAFAVSIGSMTTSTAYFWIVPILPKFHNMEIIPNITKSEISWIVSILTLGMGVGSVIASRVTDQFGRRTTLLTSAFPFLIGSVLILFATNVWIMYIARILWGLGGGMTATVSIMYLPEIADKEIRGTLTALTRFLFNGGATLALIVGSLMSYDVLNSLLIVLPICYFIACWWIPESPYYLLKEGKVEAAKRALINLNSYKDEKTIKTKLGIMRSDVTKEMSRASSIKELFTGKQYRKALIITIGLRITQLFTGTVPVQQHLARIIQLSNSDIDVPTALVVFGAVRFIIGVISPLVVDRIGRRPLLMSTFAAASVILIILGSYFFMQRVISNETAHTLRYIVFSGILAYIIIANIGFDTLIFIIPAEIFPLNVKSIAMTCFNIFSAFLNFVVLKVYQSLEDYAGLCGIFWVYATVAISGFVFTYFIVPETRGKTLREIQIELQGNIYDESDEKLNKIKVIEDLEES